MTLKSLNINKDWTLFLDRDGVINKRLPGDYVKTVFEFEFLEGVTEAIKNLSGVFGKIVVVTNQQGIAKRVYSEQDLHVIHSFMLQDIEKAGGRIDKVYFAPNLASENNPMRKPGTGMALAAKKDFPEIDFSKSIMVGDSESDIQFGKASGMKTVFISAEDKSSSADFCFSSLLEFTKAL